MSHTEEVKNTAMIQLQYVEVLNGRKRAVTIYNRRVVQMPEPASYTVLQPHSPEEKKSNSSMVDSILGVLHTIMIVTSPYFKRNVQ